MNLAEVIGDAAACLTTLSFFPQAVRVIRTRDTGAISLIMYLLFTSGVGYFQHDGTVEGNARRAPQGRTS